MVSFTEEAGTMLEKLVAGRSTGKLITSQHRLVIAQICRDAKDAGMSVEQLVILLKRVLDRAPHSEDGRHSRSEIKDRLVSVCIEEYYRLDDRPNS